MYDRYGKLVKECEWVNGIESDIFEGNGSEPMNIGMKHLKLTDNCVLVDWDVSWLLNLESTEIGNDCFGSVKYSEQWIDFISFVDVSSTLADFVI